ncbi:MAG: hemoglobin [Cryomorphaceae bacterium]|jgi:hemoglobin
MLDSNGLKDVRQREDIQDIVARFYAVMLKDPIVGFIFTDIVKIDLEHHLPIIVDFWSDSLFRENRYHGNPLQKHLEIHRKVPLKPGHFTRWLYLFKQAVDEKHAGENAATMKLRAEMVANSISAKITEQKRSDVTLTLESLSAKKPQR